MSDKPELIKVIKTVEEAELLNKVVQETVRDLGTFEDFGTALNSRLTEAGFSPDVITDIRLTPMKFEVDKEHSNNAITINAITQPVFSYKTTMVPDILSMESAFEISAQATKEEMDKLTPEQIDQLKNTMGTKVPAFLETLETKESLGSKFTSQNQFVPSPAVPKEYKYLAFGAGGPETDPSTEVTDSSVVEQILKTTEQLEALLHQLDQCTEHVKLCGLHLGLNGKYFLDVSTEGTETTYECSSTEEMQEIIQAALTLNKFLK